MAQFFLFGFEVVFGVELGLDFAGDTLDDLNARGFQGSDFVRVVREQSNPIHRQGFQNTSRQLEAAVVGFEPQFFVGFNRVEALVLQCVGLQLGHKADAAAFLLFVDQDAGAGLGNEAEGHFELLAAIATKRCENVAGEALRVDANQRRGRVDIAQHQGYRFFGPRGVFELADKAMNAEMRPLRRKISFGKAADGWRRSHILDYSG